MERPKPQNVGKSGRHMRINKTAIRYVSVPKPCSLYPDEECGFGSSLMSTVSRTPSGKLREVFGIPFMQGFPELVVARQGDKFTVYGILHEPALPEEMRKSLREGKSISIHNIPVDPLEPHLKTWADKAIRDWSQRAEINGKIRFPWLAK